MLGLDGIQGDQGMKNKIIIGVHGVANKPPKEVSEQWWLSAINEGLEWINAEVRVSPSDFRLMYWADAMYVKPQSPDEKDGSPFKLTQPYTRSPYAPPKYYDTRVKWMQRRIGKTVNDFLYTHQVTLFNRLAKPIMAVAMKDLDMYTDRTRRFHGSQTASQFLSAQLQTLLREYPDASVLLIGHSLGSVIAYTTLLYRPEFSVDLLLSLGSPLMQLGFKQGAVEFQHEFPQFAKYSWPVVTPNIRAWKNFADWNDPVVMGSASLREYYLTLDGQPVIEDCLVRNDYTSTNRAGKMIRKPHNTYGYLRCPEVSEAIRAFLLSI